MPYKMFHYQILFLTFETKVRLSTTNAELKMNLAVGLPNLPVSKIRLLPKKKQCQTKNYRVTTKKKLVQISKILFFCDFSTQTLLPDFVIIVL